MTAVAAFTVILLVAFGLGLHVAVAMGLGGFVLSWFLSSRSLLDAIGHVTWRSTTSITLVALPLFILMGELLMRSGVSERMYESLARWLHRLPGGLLHTNVVACALFACVSGSSAATCATIGGVALPVLRKYGYSEKVALGSLAASGTLGILIPPSITFIVYGVLVEESIGKLYVAALVPGLIMTIAFMLVIFIMAKVRPNIAPVGPATTWAEKFAGLINLLPIIALMFVVLGSIYWGIATATEAAAFGVTGAFLIAALKGRINRKMIRETLMVSASTTALIMLILIGAFLLQFVVAFLGIPGMMSRWIIDQGFSPVQFVLMICVLYLILGTFMEELSMIVTTIPILLPVLKTLHVDLVWFGVIVVMLVQAAIVSPPVGMNFFVLQGIRVQLAKRGNAGPLSDIFIGVIPFMVAIVVVLALVVAFPQIALWLTTYAKAL